MVVVVVVVAVVVVCRQVRSGQVLFVVKQVKSRACRTFLCGTAFPGFPGFPGWLAQRSFVRRGV
jgi:hypothetical protein